MWPYPLLMTGDRRTDGIMLFKARGATHKPKPAIPLPQQFLTLSQGWRESPSGVDLIPGPRSTIRLSYPIRTLSTLTV